MGLYVIGSVRSSFIFWLAVTRFDFRNDGLCRFALFNTFSNLSLLQLRKFSSLISGVDRDLIIASGVDDGSRSVVDNFRGVFVGRA